MYKRKIKRGGGVIFANTADSIFVKRQPHKEDNSSDKAGKYILVTLRRIREGMRAGDKDFKKDRHRQDRNSLSLTHSAIPRKSMYDTLRMRRKMYELLDRVAEFTPELRKERFVLICISTRVQMYIRINIVGEILPDNTT